MTALTCSLLLAGLFGQSTQPAQLEHAKWKSLGFSSRIYVAATPAGSPVTGQDIVRYLSRHTIPAANLASFRVTKPTLGAVVTEKSSAVTALTTEITAAGLTLKAFAFQSTDKPDIKPEHGIWSYTVKSVQPKDLATAVNKGLDLLIADWIKAHGHRTRRE